MCACPCGGYKHQQSPLAPQTVRPPSSWPLSFWKSLGLEQDGRAYAETVSDQSIPLLSLLSTRAWGAAPACNRGWGMFQVLSLLTQCLIVAREVEQARTELRAEGGPWLKRLCTSESNRRQREPLLCSLHTVSLLSSLWASALKLLQMSWCPRTNTGIYQARKHSTWNRQLLKLRLV